MVSSLRRALRIFETFRAVDSSAPVRFVLAFVAIAQNEGTTLSELADHLRLSSASASRTVAALSDRHWIEGKSGLGLVRAYKEGRTNRLYLTPKGKAMVERMIAALEGRAPK